MDIYVPIDHPRRADRLGAHQEARRILERRRRDDEFMTHVDPFCTDAEIAERTGIPEQDVEPMLETIRDRSFFEEHAVAHWLQQCDCDVLPGAAQDEFDFNGPGVILRLYQRGVIGVDLVRAAFLP